MRSLDVVVAHHDDNSARKLADSLHTIFRSVRIVRSADDLRSALNRQAARLVISDLETVKLEHVAELRRDFGVQVVCTHRIPDEKMWTNALSQGALDCCHTSDIKGIVQAVTRNMARSQAA